MLPGKRGRANAVRHLKNAIAKAAELGDGGPADSGIVLDDQNRLAARLALAGSRGRGCRNRHLWRLRARKIQPDRRPMPELAVDFQVPARLLGEAVDHAEPEPTPFSGFLGDRKSTRPNSSP